jgi:peptidylprolyl isomerase
MKTKKYIPLFIIVLLFAALVAGCAAEIQEPVDPDAARTGDIVRLNYILKLPSGAVALDTSIAGKPLEITLGDGSLLPAVAEAVVGMKPGEKKTVTVPAKDAYPYRPELVIVVPLSDLPPIDEEIKAGMKITGKAGDGSMREYTVVEVSGSWVKLDGNSGLAGKDLTYEIELLEIL